MQSWRNMDMSKNVKEDLIVSWIIIIVLAAIAIFCVVVVGKSIIALYELIYTIAI